ncbi:hypothetical protein KP010_09145 [Methylosinus sp. KRF6]|nr:hypothetical protein [Methylosinus sp. KRF6]MBU3888507.1 hypothetical protein [Methylosinus sp. KRF6]
MNFGSFVAHRGKIGFDLASGNDRHGHWLSSRREINVHGRFGLGAAREPSEWLVTCLDSARVHRRRMEQDLDRLVVAGANRRRADLDVAEPTPFPAADVDGQLDV